MVKRFEKEPPKLTLENFDEEGTGWYLKLGGRTLAIIMPSDLEAIARLCSCQDEVIDIIKRSQREFYPELTV